MARCKPVRPCKRFASGLHLPLIGLCPLKLSWCRPARPLERRVPQTGWAQVPCLFSGCASASPRIRTLSPAPV